jgi:hypothetical protein
VENHVFNGGVASDRAILPTGVGEDGEIGMGDAMVTTDTVDGSNGGTIRIEFKSIVGAAAKIANEANEPGETLEINYSRGDVAMLMQVCRQQKGVSPHVSSLGKVKKSAHGGAEGKTSLFLFNKGLFRSGDRQMSLMKVWSGGKGVRRRCR